MGEHPSQFRTFTVDLEERDALARQVTLLSDAVTNLERALLRSREIGVALGIVMATEHVSRECAWDLLRSVSQHQHRKVRVIAAEVVETGGLPVAGRAPA